jgi:oligopeptide/dipeptide ABC transporter ATP-binding protein
VSLLRVEDLSVDYVADGRRRQVLEGVSFQVERGEVLGIVGESGCGKTTLARALARLLPRTGRIRAGKIFFDDQDILTLNERQFRPFRWDRISMIFQAAMSVLNPVFPVGAQISEAIRTHRHDISRSTALNMSRELLVKVGIDADRANSYPHELSGGQKQRVIIAMAMALSPDIVIADEPTTALDVVTQDSVLDELVSVQRREGFSLILISHDMGIIAETCDRVAVLYAGHLVELGPVKSIFNEPAHPYTQGLINAIPRLGAVSEAVSIPGSPPADPARLPGCRFAPRCPFREPVCAEPAPWHDLTPDHGERCFFPERRESFRERARLVSTWESVRERRARMIAEAESLPGVDPFSADQLAEEPSERR